jgi:hypothetical protein
MGYRVKVQKVQRPTSRSFYVNLPIAVAESMDVEKGEQFEWQVVDKDTLTFTRIKSKTSSEIKS